MRIVILLKKERRAGEIAQLKRLQEKSSLTPMVCNNERQKGWNCKNRRFHHFEDKDLLRPVERIPDFKGGF